MYVYMADEWKSPDVAKDGSIKRSDEPPDRVENTRLTDEQRRHQRRAARYSSEATGIQLKSWFWSLVRWAGVGALLYGSYLLLFSFARVDAWIFTVVGVTLVLLATRSR